MKKIAVDIGACKGRYIDIALERGMYVIAYEPNPDLAAVLRDKYRYDDVDIIEAAAWDINGTKTLYWHKNGLVEGNSLIPQKSNVGRTGKVVPVVDIGQQLALIDEIEVIKIDAEGAEYIIIESILDNCDHTKIKRWLLEDHGRRIPDRRWHTHKRKVMRRVEELGIEIENWK